MQPVFEPAQQRACLVVIAQQRDELRRRRVLQLEATAPVADQKSLELRLLAGAQLTGNGPVYQRFETVGQRQGVTWSLGRSDVFLAAGKQNRRQPEQPRQAAEITSRRYPPRPGDAASDSGCGSS